MERRRIGSLEVSAVGLGCNSFGEALHQAAAAAVVDAALDAGIDFFDTADSYGGMRSEEFLGRALGKRRDAAVIATKFGMPLDETRPGGARPEYVRRALEESLRRLQTDRIDLYQLHAPDPTVPVEETLGALDELVTAGKIREIGCSNHSADQLREAAALVPQGRSGFVSVQNEYSLLKRDVEEEVVPECERLGVALLPYFPLAAGLLTGKYRRGQPPPAGSRLAPGNNFGSFPKLTPALVESLRLGLLPPIPRRRDRLNDRNLTLVESLIDLAEARGHTILELAVSWLLARRVVASVIAGATRPEQVRSNAAAAGWRLDADDLAAVDALLAAPAGH